MDANQRPKILIVDDEAGMRMALEMALERPAWSIRSVASAEEALPLLRSGTVDLLLLDKNLPGMSGLELLRLLRAENNPAWCVMITGYASALSAAETLNLGVKGYVEKPFDNIFRLAERLERLLALKAAHDRLVLSTERMKASSERFATSQRAKTMVIAPPGPDRDWILKALAVRHTAQPVVAASVNEVQQRYGEPALDLLIIDGGLLGPQLFSFLGRLADSAQDTRAVAITSQRLTTRTLSMMIDLGLKAVIERPLSEEAFRARIDQVLIPRLSGSVTG